MYRSSMLLWLLSLLPFLAQVGVAADREASKPRRPYGIAARPLWTSSRIVGAPEPPDPYVTEVAFEHLSFTEPLAMAVVPPGNRLAVAGRPGKIYTFDNDGGTTDKDLLIDVGRLTIGMTLHPKFAENGYLYVTTVLEQQDAPQNNIRVSRFQAQGPDKLTADLRTEKVIISWTADGHRGGGLKFGPDGYLYIGVGDGSGIADQLKTGQDLSDLNASILRIDVDHVQNGRPYAIPDDNPFVNTPAARGEVWAFGLRQPWRFSFDRSSGTLWAGDVGQDLWEMIYIIRKGGNYGWSVQEGDHPFRPQRPKGPTAIIKPIVEHPHSDFRSITGGYVYRGSRLEELKGAYLYGDYDTGKIWALRYDGSRVTQHRQLVDTTLRTVSFGEDADGEIYLLDFIGGRLHRLVKAPPQPKQTAAFPRKLSQTGLFASTEQHRPMQGLIPYSVAAPLWSDAALKQRYIALPGDGKIEYDAVTYPQPAPGAQPGWRFPDGTVLVKTFSLEMETGNPASERRLETRILHFKQMPGSDEVGAQFWRGYTYVWNDQQTDADLLAAEGADRTFTITDAAAPLGSRQQTWRFPSRAECTLCHTMSSKYALGVNTMQMNIDHDYGDVVANQLSTLEHLGVFSGPITMPTHDAPRLVDYRDASQPLDLRARSYLHANCGHCHRKWGGGNAEFQLLAALSLAETGTIDTPPGQGKFDLHDPRILVRGDPARSLIYYRMTKLGLGRMPHVGSNLVDAESAEMLRRWIAQLDR